jgi:hypothetical protein
VLGPKSVVQHLSSWIVFKVYPDPAKAAMGPEARFGPHDFFARVGALLPLPAKDEELVALGRQPICIVLWTIGMLALEPKPFDPDALPF